MNVNEKYKGFSIIGDYIEEQTFRVGYDNPVEISGINIGKGFIPTVANMNGIDTSKYKLVPHNYFACNLMHIGRDVTIPLAYNSSHENVAVSPAYYTFHIKEEKKDEILPEYLEMILTREEFGRVAWFHTDASIRGNLPEKDFKEILIPVPHIDIQRELVDVYNGVKALAEQNEALIEPLSKACEAFIVDCKAKYPEVELSNGQDDYIEICDERNSENKYSLDNVRGISIQKKLIPTKADMKDVSLTPYKLLKPYEFSYVTVTSRNGGKISLAMNDTDNTYLVSSSYENFRCKDCSKLMPEYLYLLLSRSEFDRYARFNSWGSARETFDWSELCRVKIPLPPLEVQQSIVDLYKCLEEAKKIASEAREKLKALCPALVQRAANS
jgi:type I restriction enzyme S subunit